MRECRKTNQCIDSKIDSGGQGNLGHKVPGRVIYAPLKNWSFEYLGSHSTLNLPCSLILFDST